MSDGAKTSVDLTEFNRSFAMYMRLTSKSFKDAVNNKLFDIARFAYKDTAKADGKTIKATLDAFSNKYPARTVAEMIVIVRAQNTGQQVKDLENEATKLKKSRVGHAGYTKSGWIKPMKDIAVQLGLNGFNIAKPSTVLGPGGGKPVVSESSVMGGFVWNDVAGKSNAGLVESIKETGAQSAVDKVAADMDKYVDKKLEQNAKQSGF
jgi:hypothetical protein